MTADRFIRKRSILTILTILTVLALATAAHAADSVRDLTVSKIKATDGGGVDIETEEEMCDSASNPNGFSRGHVTTSASASAKEGIRQLATAALLSGRTLRVWSDHGTTDCTILSAELR